MQVFATVGRYESSGSALFTRNVVEVALLSSIEPEVAAATLSEPIEETSFAVPKGASGRAPQTAFVDADNDVRFLFTICREFMFRVTTVTARRHLLLPFSTATTPASSSLQHGTR